MRHAEAAGIPRDTPWNKLTPEQQHWVIDGSPDWNGKWNQQWYGIKRFFEYLESKAYKMHIRVLLSKYRSYTPCPVCARRAAEDSKACCGASAARTTPTRCWSPAKRFMPAGVNWSREQLEALPGLCLHDLMLLPIDRLRTLLRPACALRIAGGAGASGRSGGEGDAQALKLLFEEITTRLRT